ncbi:MAG: hypothetical protein Q9227_003711 [Pyrenula ochraceoflavens]
MSPTFCPNCGNVLTIARTETSEDFPLGQNALECRTCPYQFILEGETYEPMYMKQKQKDDVVGSMEGEGLPEVDDVKPGDPSPNPARTQEKIVPTVLRHVAIIAQATETPH